MKVNPKVNIDPSAILRSRGLGSSSAARKHLASTVRRLSDPYVPMQQGTLKNTYQIIDDGRGILYDTPYAHYQYIGEVYGPKIPIKRDGKLVGFYSKGHQHPTGKSIEYSDAPKRGKQWDKRMMADRGDEVVDDLAKFIGGKRK